MIACEKAEGDYISSLVDKELVKRELHLTANMLGAYNKACTKMEIFVSHNTTEKKAATKCKPGKETSGIRLEKLKFDVFGGNLGKYPRFRKVVLKLIKSLCKPSKEAFG